MGWLQRLIETYDACANRDQFVSNPLPPISHTPQQAHIEIKLNIEGKFLSANIVRKEETLIPATEKSANRTGSKPPPHPLCDKIQYVAADYVAYGGLKPSFHVEYIALLEEWCDSRDSHPKAKAILKYVQKGSVVKDLIEVKLLHTRDGKLLTEWKESSPKPELLNLLSASKGGQDQGNAFIRWHVEIPGDSPSAVWLDPSLQQKWIQFNAMLMEEKGLCMAGGEMDVPLALNHPRRLRHAGDGAKLISANDANGFTFRGRFTDEKGHQACGIGYDASQKAHLALRWLIARQAFRNGDQVVVSWEISGKTIPDPLADTFALLGMESAQQSIVYAGDAGQKYSLVLKQKIRGFRSELPSSSSVVVMALDAATPGRMAIIFYREFSGAEFLDRVEAWHEQFAWRQNFGKERKFTGAPSPRDIAEAAYGQRIDERLRKACVERLLPCIVDSYRIPRDLVESTYHRAINRIGLDLWEWEKTLGVACALFRGYHYQSEQGKYDMALEPDRNTRDYLFGRLLAIAEHLEQRALFYSGEKRDTQAAKMMQRFANHPFSTWRQIEISLHPYRSRLKSRSPGFLYQLEQQIDHIVASFQSNDFMDDHKLTGEFLLGYHCQRSKLNEPKEITATSQTEIKAETEESA